MIRTIITNEAKLSIPSVEIHDKVQADLIIKDLIDTAQHWEKRPQGCVGLAAVQIGQLYRIIVIKHASGWIALINPEIIERWAGKTNGREGCLSRPGVNVFVKRDKKIRVKHYLFNRSDAVPIQHLPAFAEGFDDERMYIVQKFTQHKARVVAHEIDHLDGVYI